MATLKVFVDEAGDEGFKIGPNFRREPGYSSRWFLVAAVAVPSEGERAVAAAVNRVKARLWPGVPGHRKVLHWRKLKHNQKRVVLAELKPEQFTWLAVGMEKEFLDRNRLDGRIVRRTKPGLKTPLYNYTVRLVFERLTRLAKSMGRTLEVVFENRASLSMPQVTSYLKMMETFPGPYGSPTIPSGLVTSVTAQSKGVSKMLQIADSCSGALNNALEPDLFGQVEGSYLLTLSSKLNRVDGKLWGYGLKLFPKPYEDCLARHAEYEWMRRM